MGCALDRWKHREEGDLGRSTNRSLLCRLRCETLGPKNRASTLIQHRLQAVEAESRRFQPPEKRPSRTADLRHSSRETRAESTLQKLQVHRWEPGQGNLGPSRDAGRNRTPERQGTATDGFVHRKIAREEIFGGAWVHVASTNTYS